MLFAVQFKNREDRLHICKQYAQAHIAYLDKYRSVILVGGSLREEPSADPVGGLWIVHAKNREEIVSLIE